MEFLKFGDMLFVVVIALLCPNELDVSGRLPVCLCLSAVLPCWSFPLFPGRTSMLFAWICVQRANNERAKQMEVLMLPHFAVQLHVCLLFS